MYGPGLLACTSFESVRHAARFSDWPILYSMQFEALKLPRIPAKATEHLSPYANSPRLLPPRRGERISYPAFPCRYPHDHTRSRQRTCCYPHGTPGRRRGPAVGCCSGLPRDGCVVKCEPYTRASNNKTHSTKTLSCYICMRSVMT